MILVHGSMPAETCIELLESRLSEFDLSLSDDIVCIVMDGVSIMTKVGKLMNADQQLCYAHGIQLTLLEVLYKQRCGTGHGKEETVGQSGLGMQLMAESLAESDEDEIQNSTESLDEDDDGSDILPELSEDYKNVVHKVRAIIKIFSL
jgi:hypothetical protein